MANIIFDEESYPAHANETVLDTLLRHQINTPYSCLKGTCNTCMLVCKKGEVPEQSIKGLKNTQIERGYFLACQCTPEGDMEVDSINDTSLFGKARVIEKTFLSPDICRLVISVAAPFGYHPGQFINLRNSEGVIRSYSIASLPSEDGSLEMHVKKMPEGAVSTWIFDQLSVDDEIEVVGPYGDCFYIPGQPERSLLLVGSGTGLAPLVGIIRDALANRHTGSIKLYHGDPEPEGLYMHDELTQLANEFENFEYFPCIHESSGEVPRNMFSGFSIDLALAENSDLSHTMIYLCGSPIMVDRGRKAAYLQGASLSEIYSDAFINRELRKNLKNSLKEEEVDECVI